MPEVNSNQEVVLSEDVKKRLDKIDWDALKNATGITREQIEKMPKVATDLAYGRNTDLVYGNTPDISGQYSLRAIPGKGENELARVKAYTIEKQKDIKDDLYFMGTRITSDAIKEGLFAMTTWENKDGKKQYGRANANAGRPLGVPSKDDPSQKTYYLISIDQRTNRIMGMPVDAVKSLFRDENGNSRGVGMYGVKVTDDQIDAIVKGGAVKLDGCQSKEGEVFSAYVQFDPVQRQLVPCHPTWLKEAERAGLDTGISRKPTEAQNAEQAVAPKTTVKEAKDVKNDVKPGRRMNH